MNLFDNIQKQMFDTVGTVYGYDAVWTPSIGGDDVAGRVLLKEPTQEYDVNGVPYTPFHSIMEYRSGVFEGLFDAVRSKRNEVVTIGSLTYFVRHVEAAYDGKTYRASIEKTDQ